jgi:hypothetical protein
MRILGYAASPLHVEPPPQRAGRQPRLPQLAIALARRAVAERELPEDTAIFFGTGYGAATETEAFVEHMIRLREEQPKPRQFSASVHNTMASRVAMALGAKGPNRTYVHGELSFPLALDAARGHRLAIVGSLDESTPYIRRGRAACAKPPGGEGGAVFLVTEQDEPAHATVRFEGEAEAWVRAGDEHPSMPATATALAAGILCGELEPQALALERRPQSIGIRVVSRFGERARIVLDACP